MWTEWPGSHVHLSRNACIHEARMILIPYWIFLVSLLCVMKNLTPKKSHHKYLKAAEREMHSIKGEHRHASILERWQAIDAYFVCISECDLYDQVCTTRCVLTHLKADDGEPMDNVAAFWTDLQRRNYIPRACSCDAVAIPYLTCHRLWTPARRAGGQPYRSTKHFRSD